MLPLSVEDSVEWGIGGVIFSVDHEPTLKKTDFRKGIVFASIGTFLLSIIVVIIVILSNYWAVVSLAIDDTDGPEFGYRLDVDPSEYEDLGANHYPYTSGSEYPSFSSTVAIEGQCISDAEYVCGGSGVVISSRWILTVAHVVQELNLDETYVAIGSDYENAEAWYTAEAFYIHPSWGGGEEDLPLGFDIALIELSDTISEVYPSYWANHDGIDGSLLGATIFVSGFGVYSDYEDSYCGSACLDDGGEYYTQRRAWANTLDRLVELPIDGDRDGTEDFSGGHVVYDFDSPDGSNNSLARGNLGFNFFQDYSYAGKGDSYSIPHPLEGGAVPGDSGGPVFAKIDGKWTVIGLTSHGSVTSDYGDVGFNTRVSVHSEWICSIPTPSRPISGCT
jgi:hypothetical protein